MPAKHPEHATSLGLLFVVITAGSALLFAAGCSYEGSLSQVSCHTDLDCPDNAECRDGYCVFVDGTDAGFDVDEQQPSDVDTSPPSDADECGDDREYCQGSCVDTDSDPDHCGGCNQTCDEVANAEAVCQQGECLQQCTIDGDDTQLCEDEQLCADLGSDEDHCGGCGRACGDVEGADTDCIEGNCSYDCGDHTYCSDVTADEDTGDGECVDTDSRLDHCGNCGVVCPDDGPDGAVPICDDGDCDYQCTDEDEQFCDTSGAGQCVDTRSNVDHCGKCDNSCGDDPNGVAVCQNGDCELNCNPPFEQCDDQCVDTQVDDDHCGSCGADCGDDTHCVSGQCIPMDDCHPAGQPFGNDAAGTADDPHLICSPAQLQRIDAQEEFLDDHFLLVDDLDLDGIDFRPIARGEWAADNTITGSFEGHFNGNDHTISNLTIDTTTDRAGLFGVIGSGGGVVESVHLVDIDVRGDHTVGGLAGANAGVIRDVTLDESNRDNHIDAHNAVGGIAGWNQGTISDVIAAAEVVAGEEAGGIAGWNQGDITDVSTVVEVSLTNRRGGGVVGRQSDDATVSGASAVGTVNSQDNNVGGLVGWMEHATTSIDDSTANVDVSGQLLVGGLVGSNAGTIENSQADGLISGTDYVGGLVGRNEHVIADSNAGGTITGTDDVGGLVGFNDGDITDGNAGGAVDGNHRVGGLAGYNLGAVEHSHATGDVDGNHHVGGLIGENGDAPPPTYDTDAEVFASSATGRVSADGDRVGGLIGDHYGPVHQSYATGNVGAGDSERVGGLIGDLRANADVADTYAIGDVSGQRHVGGLIGNIQSVAGLRGDVEASYSTGFIADGIDIGGLVGTQEGTGFIDTVAVSYWNTDTSGQDDSDGGDPLSDDAFGEQSSFDGFDFESVWEMTDDRPVLQWQQD